MHGSISVVVLKWTSCAASATQYRRDPSKTHASARKTPPRTPKDRFRTFRNRLNATKRLHDIRRLRDLSKKTPRRPKMLQGRFLNVQTRFLDAQRASKHHTKRSQEPSILHQCIPYCSKKYKGYHSLTVHIWRLTFHSCMVCWHNETCISHLNARSSGTKLERSPPLTAHTSHCTFEA